MITQERLKELFHYDSETGVFTWAISAGRVRAGAVAGNSRRDGYIRIKIDRKKYLAHRLVWLYMTGSYPSEQIDHINHLRGDNRWRNLREASNQENARNQTQRKGSASGVTGVCWHKAANKWQAQIKVNGKLIYLGLFAGLPCAAKVRKLAEKKYGFHENHGAKCL